MKQRKRVIRPAGNHFLGLAALLGLAFLIAAVLAIDCFDTAQRARELYPWLLSEGEPGAASAMYTLEDVQFKWILGGIVFLLPGLCALAGGIVLGCQGWKRRREGKT